MFEASRSRALRTSMSGLPGSRLLKSCDTVRRVFDGFLHALARCSPLHIVAVERGLERNGGIEIFSELLAVLAELFECQAVQFDALFDSEAHRLADFLVRFAEGNALVNEVSCSSHSIQITSS